MRLRKLFTGDMAINATVSMNYIWASSWIVKSYQVELYKEMRVYLKN